MNPLHAAAKVARWLENQGVRYFIIGGIALQHWGETRLTRDVDVTVLVEPEQLERFLLEALKKFRSRIPNALEFAKQQRILLVAVIKNRRGGIAKKWNLKELVG